jgi:8-oxo-dGTP pyrophosphatase MutT (NUDIX family)
VPETPLRLAGDPGAVPIRDAATVVLLRDGPTGLEAFLLQRVRAMAFAAGMTVFPGGVVDARDAEADLGWVGPPAAAWAGPLTAPEPLARALVCAAVRETFEESGVLLAGPTADSVCTVDGPQWEDGRAALERGELSLAALLARWGLLLRADLLRPWAHWITPRGERRRYDTRFFVAALPSGQSTRDIGGEADAIVWLPPAEALAQAARAERGLLPPTAVTLEEIAGYRTVAEVLAAAERRVIAAVEPRLDRDPDGAIVVVLPDGRRITPLVPAARRP